MHTKISREYGTIKRWLRKSKCNLGAVYADENHTKISSECVFKKRWLRTKTGTRKKVEDKRCIRH